MSLPILTALAETVTVVDVGFETDKITISEAKALAEKPKATTAIRAHKEYKVVLNNVFFIIFKRYFLTPLLYQIE